MSTATPTRIAAAVTTAYVRDLARRAPATDDARPDQPGPRRRPGHAERVRSMSRRDRWERGSHPRAHKAPGGASGREVIRRHAGARPAQRLAPAAPHQDSEQTP